MYPTFHIAFVLLLFEIPYIKNNYRVNRFAAIIGSLLPDFFDKPLELLELSSGKGIFHTLLFAVIVFLVIHAATKGNFSISLPILIGTLIHLVLDEPQVPYFWPFFSEEFVEISENPIANWASRINLSYWVVIITEIIGGIILLWIIINNKLYSFSEIVDYLKTNTLISDENVDKKEESVKFREKENLYKSIIYLALYFVVLISFAIFLNIYDALGL